VIRSLAAVLLFGTFLHPVRVTYWVQSSNEYDLVIKDHLGVDHERICGIVSKDGDLWDTVTLISAGAHEGISRPNLPLDAAKLAAEQDCR
jgi:hypothetical protein